MTDASDGMSGRVRHPRLKFRKLVGREPMKMKCGRCDRFAPMDTFKVVPGTNKFVCGECFHDLAAFATANGDEVPANSDDGFEEEFDSEFDDGLEEEFDDSLEDEPEETISQKANRIWRQRQIDKLEEEQELLASELDSLCDDIGYDRITMDEEDCLVAETLYGFQLQDRLDEIERELERLRSKQ